MQVKLDQKGAQLLEEKKKRHDAVAREVEKRKRLEQEILDLNQVLEEMSDDLAAERSKARQANKAARSAAAARAKAESLSAKRLALLKDLKLQLGELQDSLVDETQRNDALERMHTIKLQIKRERVIGRRGGGSKWPVHVVLLICELLVNGAKPTSVRGIMQTTSSYFTGVEESELPSVNFIRQCRTVLQNLNETLAALRLGRAKTWHQLFTDGTSRRQIAFQNLVIALMEDGKLDPVIVSSCMVVEDETSENVVKTIVEMVSVALHCVLLHLLHLTANIACFLLAC